jgi:acetyl esterase/lipase
MRLHRLATLLLALALSVGAAAAQPPEAGLFFGPPQALQARLSPGGKRLAFLTPLGNGRLSIAVLDLQHPGKLYRPSIFKGVDVTRFEWVNDDRLVYSVMDLRDTGWEQDRRAPGLFSVRYDGSEARVLVYRTEVFGGSALVWNHELLSVPAAQTDKASEEIIVGREEIRDGQLTALVPLWLNARSGSWRRFDTEGAPPEVLQWWFDSAGHPRAAFTSDGSRGAYHWHGPGDIGWRRIAEFDLLHAPFDLVSIDDQGQLYVSEPRGEAGTAVLTLFDFATLKPRPQALVDVPGFDFSGAVLAGKPGAAALGVRVEADAETTVWFDPTRRALQQTIDAALPGRINRVSCRHCGEPGMVALVQSFSDRDPGSLYLYEAESKKLRLLIALRPGIDPQAMARVDFRRIPARDGRDLPLWLTLPPGVQPGHPAPAIVMVHGGPWDRGGSWEWDGLNQFLASRGWLVIEPEFRGSAGYGDAHLRAGFKQWGQAMEDDLADALLWAQKQGLAREGKVCIAGASYGGYAALMGPVRHPALFGCVAAWLGVTDLDLMLEGSFWTRDDTSQASRKYSLPQLVGDSKLDAAMLRANSPALLAERIRVPVLLAYGEADQRVPLAHGRRMRAALEAAGNPPVWITYPGEGHGWTHPEHELDFARQLEAFLREHLQ